MTKEELQKVREVLIDIKYGLEGSRIWGGMEWTYHPLHSFKYLPLRDKAESTLALIDTALEQTEQEPWSTREKFYEAIDRAVENVKQDMRIKTVTMQCKDCNIRLPIIDAYSGHVLVEAAPVAQADVVKDAERYRAIRDGLEVDPDNSGIVVSLIDDFGGETLRGEQADAAIDAAIAAQKGAV